uniref:Uncharacterized protein n=1 Tax=Anopheles dirus TaxID=7168 RepID=A0A182NJI3_9DIPT
MCVCVCVHTKQATSIQSPKSPVNQLKYPTYPAGASQPHPVHYPGARGAASTVAFSGGRAVLPNKPQPQHQHHYQQQPHQQQQQQQQQYHSGYAPSGPTGTAPAWFGARKVHNH